MQDVISTLDDCSEEQAQIIASIIDKYIKETTQPLQSRNVAIFIGGGSGAGKSTIRKIIQQQYAGFLIIDPDEIKTLIPSYEKLQAEYGYDASAMVHEQSSEIAKKLLILAQKELYSFMYDATLKNVHKFELIFKELKLLGYNISLVIVDCDIELAIKRVKARETQENRSVPENIVIQSHKMIPVSFRVLNKHCSEWVIYNTDQEQPKQIAVKHNNSVNIIDTELYTRFMSKSED
ncbi:hypothetical protein BKG92_06915 [Rodentibacter ratti]|uniref:Zeta toxin domain-containing protein n=2 Tax=Rodentibacter TaxID=1960084 RepID=A0A1V3KXB6_9PAST|nr:zeta toxin family protein [Rodentibacter ratti]OOF82327.1 hypothetical protein BKG92_06915 [Rodentibacter ratti]